MLTQEQRQTLLRIARESIEAILDGRRPELRPEQFDARLRAHAGAFVTLRTKQRHDLRGCIGSIQAAGPLWQSVSNSAINAAFRDPRFHPMQKDEWPEIELEISVMGPIVPVTNLDQIEVGRDGLIVSLGGNAGLLLPQVATEYGWDRETFLSQTCVKAGLPPDSWRTGSCRIEHFSAEVFCE